MPTATNPDGPWDQPRLLVSLATYNEAGNLRPLVESIRQYAPHASILVIDDHSPDGTGRIADELKASMPDIHVIHRPAKQGLGTAVMTGMKHAIANGFDYFLNLDADFSHPPRFIPDLLAGMGRHDVMIGSRYVPGGGVEGEFNLKRKFMSTGINLYARMFLGLQTKDNSGSFRCYRVSKLAQIDFDRIRSRGYSFMEEILFWCRVVGCRMGETPILFENRRAGQSKINKQEAIKALQIIAELGAARALGLVKIIPQPAGEDRRPEHEGGPHAGESGQRAGESGQRAGESGQRAGESGRRAGESGQRAGESGRRAGESGRLAGESGRLARESGQPGGEPTNPRSGITG